MVSTDTNNLASIRDLCVGEKMSSLITKLGWGAFAMTGASAFAFIALHRGESIGAIWIVIATVCVYTIAYRFYSQFIATPCTEAGPHPHDAGVQIQ